MRLCTIATATGPRACALVSGKLIDLQATDATIPASVRLILEGGAATMNAARAAASSAKAVTLPGAGAAYLPPVPDAPKILCIGLNYRDHAAETGAAIPRDPIVFSKFCTALIGHEQAIVLPSVSEEVDYEAELVVVLGKAGKMIPKDRAREHIAGYMVGHDVSARDWQLKKDGKQWLLGKTFDTFAPCGPVLVTADEVPDPHNLGIRLRLNGATMQDSSTKQMIFGVDELVAYISQVVTLQPGDLIFTGTPPGVGVARQPPVWLKKGDVVEVEIDGLGTLRNSVVGE